MNTISELMTHDHRDCDGIFARAEELASDATGPTQPPR